MGSTAVMVSQAGGRRNHVGWRIITSLVLDGLSSRHTRRAYSQALEEFLIWLCADTARPFTRAAVQRYRTELQAKGPASASVNVRISAIGVWLSFILDLPTGAAIVATFGAALLILAAVRRFVPGPWRTASA